MTSPKPTVLELAKQGNPKAIEALLNRQLQPKGITAKVTLNGDCLQVMLESSEILDQPNLVEFISNGVEKLKIKGVSTLQIFGRQIEGKVPLWSQTIIRGSTSPRHSPRQQQPTNIHLSRSYFAATSETSFRVKHNEQELIASDIEELKELIRNGQISLTDYVHNPVLNKWMYVQELAEIEAVLKQQKSSEQAAQYNQMSFVFAGFGLVMLLFHPFAGLVLLIVGLVFSALYYTKKGTIGNAEVTPVGTVRDPSTRTKTSKSRVTTAILAVLLGSLGVHFFYLKAWGWGFICIFLFWTYIPTIAGIILGIRYLTMSDKDFERRAKKVQGAFGPIEI